MSTHDVLENAIRTCVRIDEVIAECSRPPTPQLTLNLNLPGLTLSLAVDLPGADGAAAAAEVPADD